MRMDKRLKGLYNYFWENREPYSRKKAILNIAKRYYEQGYEISGYVKGSNESSMPIFINTFTCK